MLHDINNHVGTGTTPGINNVNAQLFDYVYAFFGYH